MLRKHNNHEKDCDTMKLCIFRYHSSGPPCPNFPRNVFKTQEAWIGKKDPQGRKTLELIVILIIWIWWRDLFWHLHFAWLNLMKSLGWAFEMCLLCTGGFHFRVCAHSYNSCGWRNSLPVFLGHWSRPLDHRHNLPFYWFRPGVHTGPHCGSTLVQVGWQHYNEVCI